MSRQSMRIEYGKHLVRMGDKYPQLIVLEADLKESTQSVQFEQAYPGRYIDVGVAEQNMVGIAAGLALAGKIPITHSFACFTSMRACEQIRTSIAYPKLNVKLVATHSGVSTGTAGTTHHAIEDIAIMRAIPNMSILVPGDVQEMRQALEASLRYDGPVYIRTCAVDVEDIRADSYKFSIGKARKLREGNDATIITTGIMAVEGMKASDILKEKFGIKVRVLQMVSVKPIDKNAVVKSAKETGYIITVEEHNIIGGLGSAVCEIAAEAAKAKVKRIGIGDCFCGVGSAGRLLEEAGLTAENIAKQAVKFLKK